MNTIKILAATSVFMVAAIAAQAQELKIGYVNSERVLREAIPAKAAQAKLETEFSKREKDLADVAARLKAAVSRVGLVMTSKTSGALRRKYSRSTFMVLPRTLVA